MRLLLALAVIVSMVTASAQTMAPKPAEHDSPQTKFPYRDELYVVKNFRFGDGGTLPELKLHYLTLGTAHR
ncbi:MAG: hypothetical protein ACRYGF_01080, partial [Janthinobacterium lividum]